MRIERSWVNKRVVEGEEGTKEEGERNPDEGGGERWPLRTRSASASASVRRGKRLKKKKEKMKTLDAASSGGKEIPVSRNETGYFSTLDTRDR